MAAWLPNLGGVQWAFTSHVLPSFTGKGRQLFRELNIPKIILLFSSFFLLLFFVSVVAEKLLS